MNSATLVSELTNSKTYTVSDFRTLIDINNNLTNFSSNITASSSSPFLYCFATQEELDNGKISLQLEQNLEANIISNNGIFNNYFLVLKTNGSPLDINVTIDTQEVQQKDKEERNDKEINESVRDYNSHIIIFSAIIILVLVICLVRHR